MMIMNVFDPSQPNRSNSMIIPTTYLSSIARIRRQWAVRVLDGVVTLTGRCVGSRRGIFARVAIPAEQKALSWDGGGRDREAFTLHLMLMPTLDTDEHWAERETSLSLNTSITYFVQGLLPPLETNSRNENDAVNPKRPWKGDHQISSSSSNSPPNISIN